jgi:hypothetical protein
MYWLGLKCLFGNRHVLGHESHNRWTGLAGAPPWVPAGALIVGSQKWLQTNAQTPYISCPSGRRCRQPVTRPDAIFCAARAITRHASRRITTGSAGFERSSPMSRQPLRTAVTGCWRRRCLLSRPVSDVTWLRRCGRRSGMADSQQSALQDCYCSCEAFEDS